MTLHQILFHFLPQKLMMYHLLDELGLSASNVLNFGDGLNDRELFDLVGLSMAMKESHPEILEKADFVTDTIENDKGTTATNFCDLIFGISSWSRNKWRV